MLYLHIPFCKQACSYCNFHFSTSMKTREAVLAGIRRELVMRRPELPAGPVPSVYFGGGTPSLLTATELEDIFGVLRGEGYLEDLSAHSDTSNDSTTHYPLLTTHSKGDGTKRLKDYKTKRLPEVTFEANPDDLDEATIQTLAASPVNRLSIGIQSFFGEDLRFMNRAHNAAEARSAVEKVNRAGFADVSIDLIYGGQTTTDKMWAENLRIATDLGVTHISAYALTVEPKTALGVNVAKGKVPDTDDAKFNRHFNISNGSSARKKPGISPTTSGRMSPPGCSSMSTRAFTALAGPGSCGRMGLGGMGFGFEGLCTWLIRFQ